MKHEHFQEIDSTQDYLNSIKPDGEYLVSCDKQTKGKGRHNRVWEHQNGALAMSFTMIPNEELTLTALEVAVLINQYFKNKLLLKWPNDIMNSRLDKCGGILIDNKENLMVVGVGLNLQPNKDYGSIHEETHHWDNQKIALAIYQYILQNRLKSSDVIKNWEKYCCHLSEKVSLDEHEGIFEGVGKHGEAIITIDGIQKTFYSGSLLIG